MEVLSSKKKKDEVKVDFPELHSDKKCKIDCNKPPFEGKDSDDSDSNSEKDKKSDSESKESSDGDSSDGDKKGDKTDTDTDDDKKQSGDSKSEGEGGNESSEKGKEFEIGSGESDCEDCKKPPPDCGTCPPTKKFVCFSCETEIVSGKVVIALNHYYHVQCFRCVHCSVQISGTRFLMYKGEPCCSRCYNKFCGRQCYACCRPIVGSKCITALGYYWHKEHFVCCMCKKFLRQNCFIKLQKKSIICKRCYKKTNRKICFRCKKVIRCKVLSAMGKCWHRRCFRCFKCRRRIGNGTFYVNEGFPYCERCQNSKNVCGSC